jgi:glycosyltransferase involved in cell wall biosynthesis
MPVKAIDAHSQKRIAFIFNHDYFLGGGEISLFELIRKLDNRFYRPVVVLKRSGDIETELKKRNIKVHLIEFPPLRKIFRLTFFKVIYRFIRILKDNDIDLIHTNGSRACFYGAIAGRLTKTPVIWHVRESLLDFLPYDWLLSTMANAIICVSKSVKEKRFGRFGKEINKKISVIYNGVDVNKFKKSSNLSNEVRAQLQVLPSDILIGLIGNIIPRKAQDFFLKGFSEAKFNRSDISAKVIIVGRFLDKQYQEYLERLVIDLDLKSHVIFHKFSSDIIPILSAIDIFVLTSKSEGFCRSLLEAMSCSLPVIATRISEIEEAIVDKSNGILVDLNDSENLASAIISLCTNDRLRNEIGVTNRSLVHQNFDLNLHAKAIQSLYSQII